MGLLGISLLVGAVVWLCFRPPTWILMHWRNIQQPRLDPPSRRGLIDEPRRSEPDGKEGSLPNGLHTDQKEKDDTGQGNLPVIEEQQSRAQRDRLDASPAGNTGTGCSEERERWRGTADAQGICVNPQRSRTDFLPLRRRFLPESRCSRHLNIAIA